MIIDTHCHLDVYRDREATLADAVDSGVAVMVATNRPTEYRNVVAWSEQLPQRLRSALTVGLGIHPEVAGSVYQARELALFEDMAPGVQWISEIGLDRMISDRVSSYFGGQPTLVAQRELLERVLAAAPAALGYSVHSKGASRELATMLAGAGVRAVFHWFSDTVEDARFVADQGHLFSVNPAMLNDQDLRDVARWIPDELLLVESDGPFVQWQECPMTPADCSAFLPELGALREQTSEEIRHTVQANSQQILARLGHPSKEANGV